ncbi:MAG: ArsR/SmtB family transcription factor [Thiomonas sp.]
MSAQLIPTPLLPTRIAVDDDLSERVFVLAAELFSALATPIRLRILGAICAQGKSVNAIVEAVESTQPNVSQHLKMLYLAGIVAKRRIGNQMVYRVQSEEVLQLCDLVCARIASELAPQEPWSEGKTTHTAKHLGVTRPF